MHGQLQHQSVEEYDKLIKSYLSLSAVCAPAFNLVGAQPFLLFTAVLRCSCERRGQRFQCVVTDRGPARPRARNDRVHDSLRGLPQLGLLLLGREATRDGFFAFIDEPLLSRSRHGLRPYSHCHARHVVARSHGPSA